VTALPLVPKPSCATARATPGAAVHIDIELYFLQTSFAQLMDKVTISVQVSGKRQE
jgi:hypothetical protein